MTTTPPPRALEYDDDEAGHDAHEIAQRLHRRLQRLDLLGLG